jgi:hypothetical protein
MMQTNHVADRTAQPISPQWSETVVAVVLEGGRFLLQDGRIATQALSCLLEPRAGDRVLGVGCRDGACYIVHLLARPDSDQATLCAPGMAQLTISQPQLALQASTSLSLRALRDVELSAATGTLTISARNLFQTVTESLVENVRFYIGCAEQYLLEVKHLLRQHGEQVMVTADKDVKVDADRISMG